MHLLRRVSQDNKDGLRNPWFLSLLGIIAVFLLVNITFIVFAVSSNPGLVADDYYEQGREYEMRGITRLAARRKLNWTSKLEIPARIFANTPTTYRFSAVDSRGVAIMDADVKFILYRPSDAKADFTQAAQQIAPGLYQTQLSLPLPGIWDLNLKVKRGEEIFYDSRRLSVQSAAAR